MKKKVIIILGIILLFIVLISSKEKEIRVRVLANSNSVIDQDIKKEVVNVLIEELDYYNKDINKIEKNLNSIKDNISNVTNKYSYSCKIEIKNVNYPPKEYEGKVISGGTYETLLVTIGEGKGKNWWSLLYPEYYNVNYEDFQSSDVEIKFYLWELFK